VYPYCRHSAGNTEQQKYPPAFYAEMVFAFDYNGMKKTDYQKSTEPY
jgi:hypothetical protein